MSFESIAICMGLQICRVVRKAQTQILISKSPCDPLGSLIQAVGEDTPHDCGVHDWRCVVNSSELLAGSGKKRTSRSPSVGSWGACQKDGKTKRKQCTP